MKFIFKMQFEGEPEFEPFGSGLISLSGEKITSNEIQKLSDMFKRSLAAMAEYYDKNEWPRKDYIKGERNKMNGTKEELKNIMQHPCHSFE